MHDQMDKLNYHILSHLDTRYKISRAKKFFNYFIR